MITAAAGAALAITPALAAKPASKPDHPQKPPHPAKCKINSVGYNASGNVLTITDWTQTKGADTTTDTSDDRYSGTLTVDVKKANHKAYPSWTDVLEVLRLLGYRKTQASQIKLRNGDDWTEAPDAPADVRREAPGGRRKKAA